MRCILRSVPVSELEQVVIELIAKWQNRAEELEAKAQSLAEEGSADTVDRCKSATVQANVYRACARMLATKTGVLK